MTPRELIALAGEHSAIALAVQLVAPALSGLLGLLPKGAELSRPRAWTLSVMVYAATIPGCAALALAAKSLLFRGPDLLDLPLVVSFVPIAVMIATLWLIGRQAEFDDIPGFDRLSGLIMVMLATFAIAFFLSRTRLWIVFGGSMLALAVLAILVFLLLSWGLHVLMGRPDDLDEV
ncbi:MAG: hypothetical protein AAF533_23600 [Acidobacteriota bacterium]